MSRLPAVISLTSILLSWIFRIIFISIFTGLAVAFPFVVFGVAVVAVWVTLYLRK